MPNNFISMGLMAKVFENWTEPLDWKLDRAILFNSKDTQVNAKIRNRKERKLEKSLLLGWKKNVFCYEKKANYIRSNPNFKPTSICFHAQNLPDGNKNQKYRYNLSVARQLHSIAQKYEFATTNNENSHVNSAI